MARVLRPLLALLAAGALLVSGLGREAFHVEAAPPPSPPLSPPSQTGVLVQLDGDLPLPPKPRYRRLDSRLNLLVEHLGESAPQAIGSTPFYEDVAVTVRLSDGVAATVSFLEQGGARVANVGTDYIEAYVPVPLLAALAEREGVLRVETIVPPQPAVTSQGTGVHRSPVWNARGFTGAGVKVGIIDVGFIGYSALMGSELPSTVVARCYITIGAYSIGSSSSVLSSCQTKTIHGTAVAEAVMDIAPNAILYIANPKSPADLEATASWMASQGVKVINHSVGWIWEGPGDGTSPSSSSALGAVDIAVTGGMLWVNAAGNEAEHNWFGGYSNTDLDGWLEFAAGVEGNSVQLDSGETLTVQLRWEDSWGSAARDFDLYLYNSSLTTVVAASEDEQSGGAGQNPHEVLQFTASTTGTYNLAIRHFAGSAPTWLQLNAFTGQNLGVAVASTSIANPAESANPGMLAAGAAGWSTLATIESFSSQGPTMDGRTKPDIVGADGGDSASSGAWFGTSQASPHVAGLAALVLERSPGFTPAQVASYLKSNALPRGSVPNNTWGFGLAQLPSLTPGLPRSVIAAGGDGEATVSWSAPVADGGSTITHYTVTSTPGSLTEVVSGPPLRAVVTGLTNGTPYTFTVTATNAIGTSDASTPSNSTIPSPTPASVPALSDWSSGALALGLGAALLAVLGRRRPFQREQAAGGRGERGNRAY